LLFATLACGAGEVTLVIERAGPEVPRPGALRVLFQVLGEPDPLVFSPVGVDDPSIDERRFADIPPGTTQYADVLGCAAPNSCSGDGLVARGCSERFELAPGESRSVTVVLELPEDGLLTCEEVAGPG
jgi:hypothetical protein